MPDRDLQLHGALISAASVFAGDTIDRLKNEGLDNGVNDAARGKLETIISSANDAIKARFSNFSIAGTDLTIEPEIVGGPLVSAAQDMIQLFLDGDIYLAS